MAKCLLETNRLRLKELSLDDSLALAPILSNPKVMRFSLGRKNLQETVNFIREQMKSYEENGFGLLAVFEKESKSLIGYCGISIQEIEERHFLELGYRIDSAFWGQGIGTEAASAVRDYAFEVLGIANIISIIDPENRASLRIAQKLGMVRQGETLYHNQPVDIYLAHCFRIMTDRLILRKLKISDAQLLKGIFNGIEVFSSAHILQNIAKGRQNFIQEQILNYTKFDYGIWAITYEGEVIGLGGINPQHLENKAINELYLCLGPNYQGRRFGLEAVSAIIEYAKDCLELSTLVSFIDEDDDSSIHLARTLGMDLQKSIASNHGNTLVYILSLNV